MNHFEGFEIHGVALDTKAVSTLHTPRKSTKQQQQKSLLKQKRKNPKSNKKSKDQKHSNSAKKLDIVGTTPCSRNTSDGLEQQDQSRWKQLYGKQEEESSSSPITTTTMSLSSRSEETLLQESNPVQDWCCGTSTSSNSTKGYNQIEPTNSNSNTSYKKATYIDPHSSSILDYSSPGIKSCEKKSSTTKNLMVYEKQNALSLPNYNEDSSDYDREMILEPEPIEQEDDNNHYDVFLAKLQKNFPDQQDKPHTTSKVFHNQQTKTKYQQETQTKLKKKKCVLDYSNTNLYLNFTKIKTPQDPKDSKYCNTGRHKQHASKHDDAHDDTLTFDKITPSSQLRTQMLKKYVSIRKKCIQHLQHKVIHSWKSYAYCRNQFYLKIQNIIQLKSLQKYYIALKQNMTEITLWNEQVTRDRAKKIKSVVLFIWRREVAIEKMKCNGKKKILTSCLLEWHLVSRLARDLKILQENKKHRESKANEILMDISISDEMGDSDAVVLPEERHENCVGVTKKVQPRSNVKPRRRKSYVCNIKNKPMMQRVTTISRLPLAEQHSGRYQQREQFNVCRGNAHVTKSEEKENEEPERIQIKKIQKNRLILREIQREKWRLAEMHFRIFSLKISFITWKEILNVHKIKNNKAQLYHHDLLKQTTLNNWKLYIKNVQNKRELVYDQNMENAANYFHLHLMWKSLMVWWEFVMHRRKLKEGVTFFYLQYMTRKALRKWSRAYAVEAVRLWNLEKQGSILAKRITLRWIFNQWLNVVLFRKKEKTLDERVDEKWIQVRKWLEATK